MCGLIKTFYFGVKIHLIKWDTATQECLMLMCLWLIKPFFISFTFIGNTTVNCKICMPSGWQQLVSFPLSTLPVYAHSHTDPDCGTLCLIVDASSVKISKMEAILRSVTGTLKVKDWESRSDSPWRQQRDRFCWLKQYSKDANLLQ